MRQSPRDRRLQADFKSVQQLSRESSIFGFVVSGTAHQQYRLLFNGKGLARDPAGRIGLANQHEVIVELGAAYPRMMPQLTWQTPIFHPNISNNGVVCLGGYGAHWVPSLMLDQLCGMLWDMIRYRNFDTDSPYNRDAALWIRAQNQFSLPLDRRNIRDRVAGDSAGAAPKRRIIDSGMEIITPGSDEITFIE